MHTCELLHMNIFINKHMHTLVRAWTDVYTGIHIKTHTHIYKSVYKHMHSIQLCINAHTYLLSAWMHAVTHMNAFIFTHGYMNTYIYVIFYITLHYYPPVQASNIYNRKAGYYQYCFTIPFKINNDLLIINCQHLSLQRSFIWKQSPYTLLIFDAWDWTQSLVKLHTFYC